MPQAAKTERAEPAIPPTGGYTERLLAAIVALLAADREEKVASGLSKGRSEVVLRAAGLTIKEIADITGKDYQAVRSTLRRSEETKEDNSNPRKPRGEA